jgi:glycosyltransferase involved in cell wall biosynthesis
MTIEPRLPISVCMISGAEAGRINRALESVAGWTSEIIVVLNEDVTDGTGEIARKHGAKVFREPWKGHIAQKNSAVDKAAQPWILGLDADEVVSPPLRAEITRLLAGSPPPENVAAYGFPRCAFYCGRWIRHGDWYPDRQTRLWRRGRARWGGRDPHDKLIVEGPVERLRGDLQHFSNDSINQQIQKLVPFSDEFVRQRLAEGRTASWLDLAVRPGWRFFRAYFLKLGLLDGWPGYYIAWLNAFSAVTRYAKVREIKSSKPPSP